MVPRVFDLFHRYSACGTEVGKVPGGNDWRERRESEENLDGRVGRRRNDRARYELEGGQEEIPRGCGEGAVEVAVREGVSDVGAEGASVRVRGVHVMNHPFRGSDTESCRPNDLRRARRRRARPNGRPEGGGRTGGGRKR